MDPKKAPRTPRIWHKGLISAEEMKKLGLTVKPWEHWLTAADERIVLKALRHMRDDIHLIKTEDEDRILDTLIGELRKSEQPYATAEEAGTIEGA